jgi:hypothetical protein
MKRIGLFVLAIGLVFSVTGCHVVDVSNVDQVSGSGAQVSADGTALDPNGTADGIIDANTSNHSDQNAGGADTTQKSTLKIPAMSANLAAAASNTDYIYWPQSGSPAYVTNFAHPDAGCNWLGIAGQIFDKQGNPVSNLVVNVGGALGSSQVSLLGMTGTSRIYGSSAYEVVLGSHAQDSNAGVWVQISNLSGKPVSERMYLRTYASCDKNLIILNYHEAKLTPSAYLPVIGQGSGQ